MERDFLLKLMAASGARRVRQGDVIVLAGSPPQNGLCYILSGSVRIIHRRGERMLDVALLKAGQFFGEYSLVLERPTDFDAIAETPDTAVMFLNHERFLREARTNPAVLRELLVVAMGRIGTLMQTFVRLNAPVRLDPEPDLQRIIASNRGRNLAIPELVNNTRSAFHARGRAVYRQHDPNDGSIYLLTEGQIGARYELESTSGTACLFEPGDMFGYSRPSVTPARAYTAMAECDSRVMTFDHDYLVRLLQLNMECFWSVFRTAVTQIVVLDGALHDSVAASKGPAVAAGVPAGGEGASPGSVAVD